MTFLELKEALVGQENLTIILPDGDKVPAHFHVTEVGKNNYHFIDCGGTERNEVKCNLQLWTSIDYQHRLEGPKLLKILEMAETKLSLSNEEVEVEHQGRTIGKYGLKFNGEHFTLINTNTACLALEDAYPRMTKAKKSLSELGKNACTGTGCC